MKRLIFFFIIFLGVGLGIGLRLWQKDGDMVSPVSEVAVEKEKPLEKYSFVNLKDRGGINSEIKLEKVLKEEEGFTAYLFSYFSEDRKVTGLAHIPKDKKALPVIIMLRGWVDQEIYKTGVGTSKAGEVFAQNGFITLAPDFLGYGESDDPPEDVWEERFLKPVAVMDLIASVRSITQADPQRIGFWGHSNGGMIALSVLEIMGESYPTTLWAPVSKPFPYDVLYYTDEYEDRGKLLRAKLAELEKDYDVNRYSFDEHLDWLNTKLQIHQGTIDDAIPLEWTNQLVNLIKGLGIDIVYYTYPGADHNMKGSWDQVVQRDLIFFEKNL